MQSDLPTRTRSGRGVVVRRSTRGPLESDDPLSPLAPSSAAPLSPEVSSVASPRPIDSSLLSPTTSRPGSSHARTGSSHVLRPPSPHVDLSFLTRPTLYTSLSNDTVLPHFTTHTSPNDATLPELIAGNHFRAAAIKAATDLCTGTIPSSQLDKVLETFQIRLSCLVILHYIPQATAEAKPLSDFVARTIASHRATPSTPTSPIIRSTPLAIIPWSLRLLLHRLAFASAPNTPDTTRRSIMALYGLGSECRAAHAASTSTEAQALWTARLHDIGLRVVNTLINADELEPARRQLRSVPFPEGAEAESRLRRALLELRIGDTAAAQRTLDADGATTAKWTKVLHALMAMSEDAHDAAVATLRELHAADPADSLVANNLAVALVYAGRMPEALRILEDRAQGRAAAEVGDGAGNPGVGGLTTATLFNLATMYELTTERSAERKEALVERVTALGPEGGGYERGREVFKL